MRGFERNTMPEFLTFDSLPDPLCQVLQDHKSSGNSDEDSKLYGFSLLSNASEKELLKNAASLNKTNDGGAYDSLNIVPAERRKLQRKLTIPDTPCRPDETSEGVRALAGKRSPLLRKHKHKTSNP
jgi:hypothetical protein